MKEQEFLKDMEQWLKLQVTTNEMAVTESRRLWEEEKDEMARDAWIRYESRLDAYTFLLGKFLSFHQGKSFHDLPDEFLGKKYY
ncbi:MULTISPECIES: DUF1912 family protein [unclassified Streptococcus]|uniref:DUF1912 family protein n=1 Tax=unclassified Streptococcus TaxID=2608887 RepID=UPI0018A9C8CF|nr:MULTISPECIES: DUF1912 family protein [unclassified Streptococcus]MBF8970791.1 DUF1912 family protein [Streptococcus sp. NLN76]MBG9368158.1 DUF1912 family protein [Streptococcus sp. NLN64]MBJ6746520.1 DUF1912 family protein [Streptococcus sp. 121]